MPAGAARPGLGAAAVPGPARPARAADGGQQRRDAVQHGVHRARGRPGLPRARRSATPGSKLVCFNDRFRNPGVYEVRFGTTLRELCDEVAGGPLEGTSIKALQIGGPLAGILPASRLDIPFDFAELAAEGCMVGHGGIVAFDDSTDMRAVAEHLLRFGAARVVRQVLPLSHRVEARVRHVRIQ